MKSECMDESSADTADGGCGGEAWCLLLHVQRLAVRRRLVWHSRLHPRYPAYCRLEHTDTVSQQTPPDLFRITLSKIFTCLMEYVLVVIIIIIISKTRFMVLSSWQSHCKSSPGSFDECRTAPSSRRPKTKRDDLGWESACTGCQNLHPPSPFIIIT